MQEDERGYLDWMVVDMALWVSMEILPGICVRWGDVLLSWCHVGG